MQTHRQIHGQVVRRTLDNVLHLIAERDTDLEDRPQNLPYAHQLLGMAYRDHSDGSYYPRRVKFVKHKCTILEKLRKQGSSPEASQSQSPRSKVAPASLATLRSQESKDAVIRLTQSKVLNSVPLLPAAK